MSIDQTKSNNTLYLNILWHQHQPLYLNPESDQLQSPWVRTHGTKDYYGITSLLQDFPNIHCTVNLTSSLLVQLEEYYVKRLQPHVDLLNNTLNTKSFFAEQRGKIDPWIDLALKDTRDFTQKDAEYLLTNVWNAFGVSSIVIGRFPQYAKLKEKFESEGQHSLTEQDLRDIKFWFYVAHFDPDFLEGNYTLITGEQVDLRDLIEKRSDGTFWSCRTIDEADCIRIVAETYKILSAIIPLHKKLMYNSEGGSGQVEVITTPFYHPILPLLYDSDLAKLCQPADPMPTRYRYPKDAEVHVAKAVQYFEKTFGSLPSGMWPAEGSVAHDIIPVFGKHGIRWIATDEKILQQSRPPNQPTYYPYGLYASKRSKQSVAIVFRDTELSDKIGFVYKHYRGEEAAEDFIQNLLRHVPQENEQDRLVSVILDGENAWEWYQHDNNGKEFKRALYRKLTALHEAGRVITVTMTEYLHGNPRRNVPAHPIETLPKLEWLWPGSWINANFNTWIGDSEKNKAWEYLRTAREDLANSGVRQPDPKVPVPQKGTKSWYAYQAWESLYAAEGSDWFWWYGTDQSALSGEKPFDRAFITFLNNVYKFATFAQGNIPPKSFEPITQSLTPHKHAVGATMARSSTGMVSVVFQCNMYGKDVPERIYIVGNHEALGAWRPNSIPLYDDGTHGDRIAGDGIWSVELLLPSGFEIEYKFSNSGQEGEWSSGEEFPSLNRHIRVTGDQDGIMELHDAFGIL